MHLKDTDRIPTGNSLLSVIEQQEFVLVLGFFFFNFFIKGMGRSSHTKIAALHLAPFTVSVNIKFP